MRIGIVVLPQLRWSEAAARWRAAEQMGFDHAWTYDHLSWQNLADEPWFATVPTLAAAAAVTSRIGLGTWVASPNFRHPVPFAKEVMTLDDISCGRFVLGVGAGGTGWDADVLGQPRTTPAQRVERLEAFVTMLDALLTAPETTRTESEYAAVDARMLPGSVQRPRPRFVVAAGGPRTVRLAVRLATVPGDGWATTGATAAEDGQDAWWSGVAGLVERVDAELAAMGREPSSLDRYLNLDSGAVFSMSSLEAFRDAVGRASELGFSDVVTHWPRASKRYVGDERVLEQVAGDLDALRGGPGADGPSASGPAA
jgi:alkanesulfonate monooxygenase SsuD/methylene tetrahydromethanopterin reductase-like flavin-dependent oxidoreductase (luciferase family)